jgi:hypothetical protein
MNSEEVRPVEISGERKLSETNLMSLNQQTKKNTRDLYKGIN